LIGPALDDGIDELRLGIGGEPHMHCRDISLVRHTDPQRDRVSQPGSKVRDVERRAVVVRLREQVG